jgi:hypothetical protein
MFDMTVPIRMRQDIKPLFEDCLEYLRRASANLPPPLRAGCSISLITTRIPASANVSAIARPMPLAAPVTTAILFLTLFIW